MKLKIIFIAFMFFPLRVFAETNQYPNMLVVENTLNALEAKMYPSQTVTPENNLYAQEVQKAFSKQNAAIINKLAVSPQESAYQHKRNTAMERALKKVAFELSFEYETSIHGQQIYDVIDTAGRKTDHLIYPLRGQMYILKGEVGVLPRLFIGARYGSSHFKRTNTTDLQWSPPRTDVWWQSSSRLKAKTEIADANIYYRIFDLSSATPEDSEGKKEVLDLLRITNGKLLVDILTGYQWQKGRYERTDRTDTTENWIRGSVPIDDEDSFYKIYYYGPRLGFRVTGSAGKFITRLSFAYAWLITRAYGNWNLATANFDQRGYNGYGLDFNAELDYQLTEHLLFGAGFNYLFYRQHKLKESMSQPGNDYDGLSIIRNANATIYGPSVVLKYIW